MTKRFVLFSFFLLQTIFLFANNFSISFDAKKLPRIPSLSSREPVFAQYCAEVEFFARRRAQGKNLSMQFYSYLAKENDTLFALAALCAIPYETIATINRIEHIDDNLAGRLLVLPTDVGIFVFDDPVSSTEILLSKKYNLLQDDFVEMDLAGERVRFFYGKRFSPTERLFFLDSGFKMPLESSWLSSSYGMRVSPISGKWTFHEGIDLAAPIGTPVFACKAGRVLRCVYNDVVYGNYVVIEHNNGISSLYAHLSKIEVTSGSVVKSKEMIGEVGKTGLATGSHLHFEIHEKGKTQDPSRFLQK